MKSNIKILALAVAAMFTVVACNNNAPEEVALDTTPIDTVVEEEIIDSVVVEEPVVEEPVKAKATTKKDNSKPAEVKTNNGDRPVAIEAKKIVKRTAEEIQNLEATKKEAKPTDRPVEIKATKKIGNKTITVSAE